MGTATVAYIWKDPPVIGNKKMSMVELTLSTSYATGGDTIPAGERKFGLAAIEAIFVVGRSGIYNFALDSYTAPTKILAYESAAAGSAFGEQAATTNMSAEKVLAIAIGS